MKFFDKIKSINTNMIIASSALIISLCALVVSVQEVRIQREQMKATMFPFMSTSFFYNNTGFGVRTKNTGNGIARINSIQVYHDGRYFKDWFEVINYLCPECSQINYGNMSTNNIQQEMISPNTEVNLIAVDWNEDSRKLEKEIRSIHLLICYSSLMGDHWVSSDFVVSPIEEPCEIIIEKEFGRNK